MKQLFAVATHTKIGTVPTSGLTNIEISFMLNIFVYQILFSKEGHKRKAIATLTNV